MLNKQPIVLPNEYVGVLTEIESTSENIFITGRAGTGKSTLLQLIVKTSKKRIAVLAPTGVAALNVRGQTIHSFFKFPPHIQDKCDIKKTANHQLYKSLDAIIIDEISMVRADLFDNIDYFLRVNREIDDFFGGVQLILFGDLFQLPPVVANPFEQKVIFNKYDTPYFFSAQVFVHGFPLRLIELINVYRQGEKFFIDLLDRVRLNEIEEDDLVLINERYLPLPDDQQYHITLCSINSTAMAINLKNLNEIKYPPKIFTAKVQGLFTRQNYPTEEHLILKIGAQVMFIKNDPQRQFVNGTIGTVVGFSGEYSVVVQIPDVLQGSKTIEVTSTTWEMVKYNKDKDFKITTEIIGQFEQLPLKLAWAVTIHKSQGKTFDHVIIDLGRGAFEYGQTYVALSRCRTLSGLYLKAPLRASDIKSDQRVIEYYERMRRYF